MTIAVRDLDTLGAANVAQGLAEVSVRIQEQVPNLDSRRAPRMTTPPEHRRHRGDPTLSAPLFPAGLDDREVKTVRDALAKEPEARKQDVPREPHESFSASWLAFAQQARRVRDDAGHPEGTDPATPESAHAAPLISPEPARLVADLGGWVNGFYV